MSTPFLATKKNLEMAAAVSDQMCREAWVNLSRVMDPKAMLSLIVTAGQGQTVAEIARRLDDSFSTESRASNLTDAQKIGILCCIEFAVRNYGPKVTT